MTHKFKQIALIVSFTCFLSFKYSDFNGQIADLFGGCTEQ